MVTASKIASQAPVRSFSNREFEFTDSDFDSVKKLVSKHTGICLSDAKRELVYGRLSRRLRQLKFTKFKNYLALLYKSDHEELVNFVNAITTNLTAFFREDHHFDYLSKTIIPDLLERNKSSKRIRIWSAGCSTGEEPYSIAMVLMENLSHLKSWDIKILATDLDTNCVDHGKKGVYVKSGVSGVSSHRLSTWFKKFNDAKKREPCFQVDEKLKRIIVFKQLNLMDEWPMSGYFDVLFCRNVVIYFDKVTQKSLFNRYHSILHDSAHLIIGHSESLYQVSDKFKSIGNTIYRK